MQRALICRIRLVLVVVAKRHAGRDRRIQRGKQGVEKRAVGVAACEQTLGRLMTVRESGRRLQQKAVKLFQAVLVAARLDEKIREEERIGNRISK